jgi:hypothetical protein
VSACASACTLGAFAAGAAADTADAPARQTLTGTLTSEAIIAFDMRPVITQQRTLSTREDVPLTITLDDLTVRDRDNVYPDDFTLQLRSGANYTITGASEITPSSGFVGTSRCP